MRNLLFTIAIAILIAGCAGTQPLIAQNHPALTMDQGTCAEVGAALPMALQLFPVAGPAAAGATTVLMGAVFGRAACQAEGSLVNGPPAQTVTTSTTSSSVQKPAN
jgi:hypothetical protein